MKKNNPEKWCDTCGHNKGEPCYFWETCRKNGIMTSWTMRETAGEDMKPDGGPAYPVVDFINDTVLPGMSLRDYFAAKASDEDITEIMNDPENCEDNFDTYLERPSETIYKITRQQARFIHADAMLKARDE